TVTHIVGTGQPNATDRLFFNNTLVATNPFVGTSVSSDRGWVSVTYKDGQNGSPSLMPGAHVAEYGEVISTGVDHSNTSPYDCLSWGAVIVSTPVADVDHDGLPDGLEDNTGELAKDAGGAALPFLDGASSAYKDIFIEADAMAAPAGTTYGDGVNPAS